MSPKRTIWFQPDGKVRGWCALLRSSGIGLVADEQSGCPIFLGRSCEACPAANDPSLGSRYVSSSVRFKDFDALCEALEMIFSDAGMATDGAAIVKDPNGQNTLVSRGYLGKSRVDQIGHVAAYVPRSVVGGSSNDLPVVRREDGSYEVLISQFDVGVLPRRLGWQCSGMDALQGRIKQRVSLNIAKRKLPAQGWRLDVQTLEDGTIEVEATKSASVSTGQSAGYSPSGWSVA